MLTHNSEQAPFFNYRMSQRGKALGFQCQQKNKLERQKGRGVVEDGETSLQVQSYASETLLLEKPGWVPQHMIGI